MKLFVSYTTRDGYISHNRLRDVSRVLENHGRAFIDAIHNDSADRQARVEQEIVGADLVVFLETSGFCTSAWVARERQLVEEHHKISVSVSIAPGEDWDLALASVQRLVQRETTPNQRVRHALMPNMLI
jgi:hypothetical protein